MIQNVLESCSGSRDPLLGILARILEDFDFKVFEDHFGK
jgi:hypothetical protein